MAALGWPISVNKPTADGTITAPAGTKSVGIECGGPGGKGGDAIATHAGPGGGGGGYAGSYFLCNPGEVITYTFADGYVTANLVHYIGNGNYETKGCTGNCGGEGYLAGDNGDTAFPGAKGTGQGDDSTVPNCTKAIGKGGMGAYPSNYNNVLISGCGANGGSFTGDAANANGPGTPGQPCSGATSTVNAVKGYDGSQAGPASGGGGGGGGWGAGSQQAGFPGGKGFCCITFYPQDHGT